MLILPVPPVLRDPPVTTITARDPTNRNATRRECRLLAAAVAIQPGGLYFSTYNLAAFVT